MINIITSVSWWGKPWRRALVGALDQESQRLRKL